MAFVDDLALVEVLIAAVAALFAYAGVRVWWATRVNDANDLRSVLRGLAVPAGALGATTFVLAVWGEMTWPFPSFMAGYNIFFFDPMILLGAVLLAYSVTVALGAKTQYVGMFALIAGAATLFYGWTGYTSSTPFTKDPLDTFLMYGAFAATGIFAFPASIVVDHFLGATDRAALPFAAVQSLGRGTGLRAAQRAAGPVVPGTAPGATPSASSSYHCPSWVQVIVLLLPVFATLAAIAAFWYFGTTLPGHLGSGPGGAP